MKVLDIYSKKDLYLITYNGKDIKKLMNEFFLKFPNEYRKNYDENLKTLEIHRVDEMFEVNDSAEYYPIGNVMMFKSFAGIPHEMMHMASSDRVNSKSAFYREGIYSLYETGLVEGMTEYLSCIAKGGEPDAYFFEYFSVAMLSSIDGIFKPYFIPSYDDFVSLFPRKIDICSLMYSLDFYHDGISKIDDDTSDRVISMIGDSVKSTIDSLIDVELSFNKSRYERKLYGEKFMDLISDIDLKMLVSDVCPDYLDYANHEIKKRILRRGK